ncbi:ankyrin [Lindgomyces ingoldianus]|uniref:Ankyrin n=1 Tax=Lindgomyces ingoldianus TaxID=673940 RepID=A0ACB6QFW2_9PLEO|nr:ankyrin [Lindgomyces ingoldianus]KAF2465007.1 ankyrin [Lindgomyces ingoldianus]
MDEFEWVKSFSSSNYGTLSDYVSPVIKENKREPPNPSQLSRGTFSSFICHVIHLERKLRSFTPIVLDGSSDIRVTGKILGQGKTFLVRHAQWAQKPNEPPVEVALKEIIPTFQSTDETPNSSHRPQHDWKDILFELRALLHEPIRYHPNLVRLLGIQWGLSPLTESVYPMLVMECSLLGTLQTLQASFEPLPFPTKQKLCYDVGKALLALHACGIVHGDVKHENVIIFPNKETATKIPYTAKLTDFGGTIMDMGETEFRTMETWTWPFQAPEVDRAEPLTRNGMVLTDVYSFGLLIWRAFTDGEGFVSLPGAAQSASDEAKRSLTAQKSMDDFTRVAIHDIYKYAESRKVPKACVDIITYSIIHTIRLDPMDRNLVSAQAALRGIKLGKINAYMSLIREKNDEKEASELRVAPGSHGFTKDSVQFMLGRYGNDVDLQDNLPGFRPKLNEPNVEEFLFEPESLKTFLTWGQQQQILEEFKEAAAKTTRNVGTLGRIKRTVAAFYLFQCYLIEFGTTFDAAKVIHWLAEAASNDNSREDADCYAQAWLWRIARALGPEITFPRARAEGLLHLSSIRGYRTSLQDILEIASGSSDQESQKWSDTYVQARNILQSEMGGVGMPYFFPNFMTNVFNLGNINRLDEQIRAHLQQDYESCLKSATNEELEASNNGKDKEETAFDRIFVNDKGHGLLHFAAARGASKALKHMITKYKCDINLPNQHVDETPLICACEGGKVACAMFLLEHGADPNGYQYSQEGPLHWLSSFLPSEMGNIALRLITAGADIELRSGGMRHDVRKIGADWEHIFEISVTPLGRAVLMNNLPAVKVLLKHGANPLARRANKHRGRREGVQDANNMVDVSSAFDLAAVLTLPDILEEFIKHIDNSNGGELTPNIKLLDEASMLNLAHGKEVTKHDPLSLQSRLVRCGANYKSFLRRTISLLFTRALPWHSYQGDLLQKKRSEVLCKEVSLGNVDIVECLLEIGYNANGTKDFRPLEKAIELNHDGLFQMLVSHKADVTITHLTPTGYVSMLHLCASRPRQSRPGRMIADALIAAGVPIESIDPRSKSPLAMAVLNQNFDVARALMEHGANVNVNYPLQIYGARGTEMRTVSILVEVLAQHTIRTLESLKFLFGKKESRPIQRPNFTVDKDNKFSVLHLLAGSEQFTEIAQISPMIFNLCLDTYSEPSFINYRHPILGTGLYYAAMNGNKVMVERLLERHADTSSNAGPDLSDSIQLVLREKGTWTPLWAAISRLDGELNKSMFLPSSHKLDSNAIQNVERTVELLAQTGDELAKEAIHQLAEKKHRILNKQIEAEGAQRRGRLVYNTGLKDHPIDLSVLSGKGDANVDEALQKVQEENWVVPGFEEMLTNLAQRLL